MIYDKRFIFPKNSPKAIKKPPGDAFIVPVMWLLCMTFYLPFGHTADFSRAMSSVFFVFTWLKKKIERKWSFSSTEGNIIFIFDVGALLMNVWMSGCLNVEVYSSANDNQSPLNHLKPNAKFTTHRSYGIVIFCVQHATCSSHTKIT